MPLDLRRCDYSVNPWRLVLVTPGQRDQELAHVSFGRKKDGLLVLQALQALDIDWSHHWSQWLPALRDQVRAIVRETESYQAWEAVAAELRSPH